MAAEAASELPALGELWALSQGCAKRKGANEFLVGYIPKGSGLSVLLVGPGCPSQVGHIPGARPSEVKSPVLRSNRMSVVRANRLVTPQPSADRLIATVMGAVMPPSSTLGQGASPGHKAQLEFCPKSVVSHSDSNATRRNERFARDYRGLSAADARRLRV